MATYGIDLGTTYSCIAKIDDVDRAAIIPNDIGEDITPSVVLYPEAGEPVVGNAAKRAARLHPDRVIQLVKRGMGKDWSATIDDRELTAPEVSAEILKYLKASVERTGEVVRDVVITVPAYFGLRERHATEEAGRLAGLNVLALIPEPVAAALNYGALTAGEGTRNVLVFDLGGGTFDTTAISVSPDVIRTVWTDGNDHLGGADWDELLQEHLIARFQEQHPDSDPGSDERFLQELALQVEQHKKDLSAATDIVAMLTCGGATADIVVTRAEFEEMTATLLEQAMEITQRTVDNAATRGMVTFDDVLLVGGSSRMPAVAEKLKERFGFDAKLHDPDKAVAKGAALYAQGSESIDERIDQDTGGDDTDSDTSGVGTAGRSRGSLGVPAVITAVPRAFGVKVLDTDVDPTGNTSFVDHILHANDVMPKAPPAKQYATLHHNQTEILIEVWEQAGHEESSEMANNHKVGDGLITGFPPLPAGSPVTVAFEMDHIGRLTVHAVETTHNTRLDFTIDFEG